MIRSDRLEAAALFLVCGVLISSSYWTKDMTTRGFLIVASAFAAFLGLTILEEKAPPEK